MKAAVLTLGRGAMGEVRRVETWRMVLAAAGYAIEVRELVGERRHVVDPVSLWEVARGRAVPETLAWSRRGLARWLRAQRPDLIVCVTARSFAPHLSSLDVPVVLDFVDELSRSYRQRAVLADGLSRAAYAFLARRMSSVERRGVAPVIRVAAGDEDAKALEAEWLPNVIDVPHEATASSATPAHDLVFFGSLSYPPNVEALHNLARAWPAVLRARSATTLGIAGAKAGRDVIKLVGEQRWCLHGAFANLSDITRVGRVSVVPLSSTVGIQNKVIDAAALGVPQILYPAATRGFRIPPPAVIVEGEQALARAVADLLDDPVRQIDLAAAGLQWVRQHHSAARWADWLRGMVDAHGRRR